jgi:hypothetical protein
MRDCIPLHSPRPSDHLAAWAVVAGLFLLLALI